MIVTLAKMGLLMLSYLGYWEFFRDKWKISVYFVPAFTFAMHFTTLFFPGLFNFLGEGAVAIYLLGLLLLANALRHKGLGFLKEYLNWGYAVFCVMFLLVAVAVRGMRLTAFDNFTHWGTVVKCMLEADRFPTFAQEIVGFGHYPLGSSALIYYFCRFTGVEEDVMMMAQAFLLLSMFLPVFSYVDRKRSTGAVVLFVMLNFVLAYNIYVTSLLVDTLLPVAGCAAMLFWHQECDKKQEEKLLQKYDRAYLVFPMILLAMNIKAAGLLFGAFTLLTAFVSVRKQGKSLKPLGYMCLGLAVFYFLWSRHCDYVFLNIEEGQHAISLHFFKSVLKDKSLQDVGLTIWRALVFAVTRKEFFWMLGFAAVLAVGELLKGKQENCRFGSVMACACASHIAFFISLVCMYVFSMSKEAALELECIDRYMKTADIFVYMLLAAYCADAVSSMERKRGLIATALTLSFALVMWKDTADLRTVFQAGGVDLYRRDRVEALLEEYGVTEGWSYLVCDDQDTMLYSDYIVRYNMNSSDVTRLNVTDIAMLDEQKGHQYIIILDEDNSIIQEWVEENYPDQAGERVIRDFD